MGAGAKSEHRRRREGRKAIGREDLRVPCLRSKGVGDPSLCWGAQLGWRARLAPAHGGGEAESRGPAGPLLATSPWDVHGRREEEAQAWAEQSP